MATITTAEILDRLEVSSKDDLLLLRGNYLNNDRLYLGLLDNRTYESLIDLSVNLPEIELKSWYEHLCFIPSFDLVDFVFDWDSKKCIQRICEELIWTDNCINHWLYIEVSNEWLANIDKI